MAGTTTITGRASGWARGDGPLWLARMGLAARGVVYLVVGLIALDLARSGGSGEQADQEGAVQEIAGRSFGSALLVVLSAGLTAYVLWRLSQAIWGVRHESDEKKRSAKRLACAGKAVVYGALLATTLRYVLGDKSSGGGGGGGGDQREESVTARALELPAGRVLVGLVGLAIVAGGLFLVHRGISQRFEEPLDTSSMSETTERAVTVLGMVGLSARGVVVGLLGLLVVQSAVEFDPEEAAGFDGTLKTVAAQPYGPVLLAVVALGVVVFGLYSFAEARYRVR